VNLIAHQRAFDPVAHLSLDAVPVVKCREWPANLLVAEVAVPFKLRNAVQGTGARNPRHQLKADQNL